MKRTLALTVLWLLAGGCSFVLDFPTHDTAGEGGAGASGGDGGAGASGGDGGSGGTTPTICEAFAPDPSFDKVAMHVVMENLDNTSIATTGLARDDDLGVLYAFGQTTGGLAVGFPATQQFARDLFLLAIPDVGDPTLVLSAQSCDELNEAYSGRMTLFEDGRQVIAGGLGYAFEVPGNWSLDLTDNVCATAPIVIPGSEDWDLIAHPFFALVSDTTIQPSFAGGSPPGLPSDGMGVDVDDNPPHLGSIGVVIGGAFDAPATQGNQPKFFVQRSTETTSDETFVLDDHVNPFNTPRFTEAGAAVDDDGTVWFGGGSCEAQFPCSEQGAFLGTLATAGPPSLLVERPGVSSAVTAIDIVDQVVVAGGRYVGALEMMGASFPEAGSNDAFVMAIDAATQDVLWSFPRAGDDPGYDVLEHDTVIDLAVLGERDCGAVYVLGCSAPSMANPECVYADVGKSAFIIKLDLATGARVWIQEIELENPAFEFFMPTAIVAEDDKVWLAATQLGSVSVAGGTVSSDGPQESVIVQLSK